MRPPRVLLAISVASGWFSVLATLFAEPRAALQAGLVASAAFLWCVLLVSARVASTGPAADGRTAHPAPRVRWALVAGLALFALVMAVRLRWLAEPTSGSDVFVPFYAPLPGGVTSSPGTPPVLLDLWRQSITQDRIAAVGLLLATVCLAVVVLALPVRRRPGRTPLARTAAALLVVLVVAYVWDSVGDAPLSGAFAAGWPALTATLVAAGVLAVSGERGDRFALVSIGALLIAVTAAADLGDLVSLSSSLWSAVDVRRDAFLEVGVAVSAGGGKDLSAAAHAGVALVGPALFAIGALHASRDDLTGSR